ncbi:MAG: LacI family DNA-binding transcriptional regulator [Desulfobacterales bacterium]
MPSKLEKPRRATVKDVAERAGVSRSTVSRVLSCPTLARPVTRAKVRRAIKDLAYQPCPIARGLATGTVPFIHVLVSDIRNPFYAELARGVEDVAREHGYAAVFANTDDSPERELECLEYTNKLHFAGLIMMSAAGRVDLKRAVTKLNRPVVLVNRIVPGLTTDAVILNNEYGGYLATKYLISLGHRRIGHLAGIQKSSASAARNQGFIKAMKEEGLDIPQGAILQGDLRLSSGEAVGRRLVQEGLKYTAIFSANDQMAIGLISAFEREGLQVPGDVSVVGFDDIAYAKLPRIQLTTVRQPSYEMSRAAMNMLLEQLGQQNSVCRTMRFEPELVIRSTCAAPKS